MMSTEITEKLCNDIIELLANCQDLFCANYVALSFAASSCCVKGIIWGYGLNPYCNNRKESYYLFDSVLITQSKTKWLWAYG